MGNTSINISTIAVAARLKLTIKKLKAIIGRRLIRTATFNNLCLAMKLAILGEYL
jgi:hypothetical protein